MSSRLTMHGGLRRATKQALPKGSLYFLRLRYECVLSTFHSHGPRIQRGTEPAMTTTAKERLNAIPKSA